MGNAYKIFKNNNNLWKLKPFITSIVFLKESFPTLLFKKCNSFIQWKLQKHVIFFVCFTVINAMLRNINNNSSSTTESDSIFYHFSFLLNDSTLMLVFNLKKKKVKGGIWKKEKKNSPPRESKHFSWFVKKKGLRQRNEEIIIINNCPPGFSTNKADGSFISNPAALSLCIKNYWGHQKK